jgi:hypothetical protein
MNRTLKNILIVGSGMLTGFLLVMLLTNPCHAQTRSIGPLFVNGTNPEGYPIFMLRCDYDQCTGPQGKRMGSPKDVARYMPEVRVNDIQQFGFDCWIICRDARGDIIGKPSPNYRNPFSPSNRPNPAVIYGRL